MRSTVGDACHKNVLVARQPYVKKNQCKKDLKAMISDTHRIIALLHV